MAMDTSRSTLTQIGNYDVVAKIAEGGMGTVYKARRKTDGLIVAIKIVPATTAKHPVLLSRFMREFQAARDLDHPNIVKAIEYGAGASPFLVLEFVDGLSLGQKVDNEGRMTEAEAVRVIAQVCNGLHAAHKQGLIHRDIKPDNIMLTVDGQAKVTDLGLVKDADGDLNLTRTGRGLGTPHYMAPEQFRNAKFADVRCDIYSLGATLYTMVTGETPFGRCPPLETYMKKHNQDFTPPKQLVPDLSDRVDWAIRRAMSADPDRRPANCREFIEDLTGRSVRPLSVSGEEQAAAQDLWYMVYRDEFDEVQTVKGTTEGIRKALRDKLLGDPTNIRVCRVKTGPFGPMRNHPEFRDLIIEPAAMSPMSPMSSSVTARTTPAPGATPTNAPPARASSDPGGSVADTVAAPVGYRPSGRSPVLNKSLLPGEETAPMPALSGNSGRLRHIALPTPRPRYAGGVELVIWLGVLVIALGTAFVAYRHFTN